MARGILETIGLAGSIVLAAHVALLGGELLFAGAVLRGAGFLALGVLIVVVSHAVTTPGDLVGGSVERVADWIVETED